MRFHRQAFDKDQRVTHAAIIESNRLSEAVAFIKSQQGLRVPPRMKTASQKLGYQKTGRKPPGRRRLVDKLMAPRLVRPAPPPTLLFGCKKASCRK